VTVNAFLLSGRLVPLTVTDTEPLAHVWPADVPADVAAAAAAALGIEHGPVTAQLLLGASGPLVAKVAARVPGGHLAELCRAALGVDEGALAVACALGEPVSEDALAAAVVAGGACVRFLVCAPGLLREASGVDDALELPGVRAVHLYRRPGTVVAEAERAGAVIATGPTRAAAVATAAEAVRRIRFVTEAAA
jgi:hypothetical protein